MKIDLCSMTGGIILLASFGLRYWAKESELRDLATLLALLGGIFIMQSSPYF